jgi:hypothetical protein
MEVPMYANLPLRSHAFVAIAALGAAATVGLTTAEAAPMSIFMSRPNVGVARAGPAFVPRPARPMLGSPLVARPGSLLGNRASNRFSPVTQASLNTTNRSSGSVNLQRRATPIAQVDRSVLTNGNNGKNSSVNLQRRATPIAQVDRGALINGNNGKNGNINLQRSGTPIAQVNRGAIPLVDRIPGRTAVLVPGVTPSPGQQPNGALPSTGQASPPKPEDQTGGQAQIEQALLDLLRTALEGQGQANSGQGGQGNGQGQANQGQGGQGKAQGQGDGGQVGQGGKPWSKAPEKVYAPVRAPSSDAARSVSRRVVEPATPPCLTKEYLETGVVLFRDVCTKEWAVNSTSVSSQVASAAGRLCLTKQYLRTDVVLFQDTCTNEWAMNPPVQQAQAPQVLEAK